MRNNTSQKKISILTFNTFGVPFFAPDITKRYNKISQRINEGDYDVVCLQELFTYYHLFLFKKTLPKFPYMIYQKNPLGPRGGLAIFSKLELRDKNFFTYTFPTNARVPFFAHIAQPGALSGMIKQNGVRIITTHLSSDNVSNLSPKNKFYPLIRAQSNQAAKLVNHYTKNNTKIILTGDFNTDKHSQLQQEFVKNTHLLDTFKNEERPTYSAKRLKFFCTEPSGRVDYIYITPKKVRSLATNYVFSEKETLSNNKKSYLSDHIGLHCILGINE